MDADEPESTAAAAPEPRHQLRALVSELRTALLWQQRAGAWAASAAMTARPAAAPPSEPSDTSDAARSASPRIAESADLPAVRRGATSLPQIRAELGECTRCKLHETRQKIAFGVGAPDAPLMFIGEAPGADEDRLGEPFVGRAGQLLDKMILAMGWDRASVYIANVLKCRPPENRDPQPDEIEQCQPFLARQILAVAPRVIVTLGRPASHLLLRTDAPMSALRGRFQTYQGIPVMPTFHPAYLLRSPERKGDTWSDLKQVIAELDRLGVVSPYPARA